MVGVFYCAKIVADSQPTTLTKEKLNQDSSVIWYLFFWVVLRTVVGCKARTTLDHHGRHLSNARAPRWSSFGACIL